MTAFHRESSSGRLPAGEPTGYFVVIPASADDQAADLAKAASILGKSWKLLLSTTLIAAISAMAISLAMRNVYRAQVLIAPVVQGRDGSAGALRNQLGGLAALAGIDVGSSGSRKQESIATLSSDGLARDFVAAENMLPELFPIDGIGTEGVGSSARSSPRWMKRCGNSPRPSGSSVKITQPVW